MFIHETGHGLPVVLIHGYPLNHQIWVHQFPLSAHSHIYAPDLPGFGQSPAQAIKTTEDYAERIYQSLQNRGLHQVVMFGHSMGGYITLAYAEKYPETLLGFGLINSRATADSEEIRKYRHDQMLKIKNEGPEEILKAMPERLLSPETLENRPKIVELFHQIIAQAKAEGMILALHAMAVRKDYRELLKQTDLPVLIIAGKHDKHVPLEESRGMGESLKKGTYVEIDSAGHMAMMEQPDIVTKTMEQFLIQFRKEEE